MKTLIYISIWLALLFLNGTSTYAQGKAILLAKNIEKQFSVDKMPILYINTERGIISVKNGESNEIIIKMKLTARNADADIARKELDLMKYSLTESRNTVFVNNQMLLSQPNQEISSIIVVEYEIYVPHETDIHVENRFGKLEIENVSGLLDGNLHYSDLSLIRKSGNIALTITIGDFNCTKSNINGKIITRHSNATMTETSGKLLMETEYGNIRVAFGNKLFYLTIHSNATDINIEHKLCFSMAMNLAGSYCPLKISGNCYATEHKYLKSDYKTESDQQEWKLIYLPPEKTSRLNINAKFGTLNLF